MGKQFRYLLFFSLFVFLGLNSCMQYKEVEMVGTPNVSLKTISLKGVEVEVAMQIKNPNKYNISIVDSDLALFAQDKKIGLARVKEKITLKKKSTEIYHFTIQTSSKDFLSSAIPVLLKVITKSNIELRVQGDIKAKAKGIAKRFPVDFKEQIKL